MDQMTMFKVQSVGGLAATALCAFAVYKAPMSMGVKVLAGAGVVFLGYQGVRNAMYAFATAKKEA